MRHILHSTLNTQHSTLNTQHSTLNTLNKILFAPIKQEDRLSLLNLLLPFISSDLIEAFAKICLHDPNYLNLLEEKLGQEFWIEKSLKPLLSWIHSGRPAQHFHHVNEEYDHLDQKNREVTAPTFLEELNYQIRSQIKPQYNSCIITSIRNEGLYILPWIAWHKQLGFEHFFIYSNDNNDGSDEILNILAKQGIITWLRNDMRGGIQIQSKILKHAFAILPYILDYKWSFACDADEYLQFNKDFFLDLPSFLERFNTSQTDAIPFYWKPISAQDTIDYKNAEITERNDFYIKDPSLNSFKMMGKTNRIVGCNAHNLFFSDKEHSTYRTPSGEKILYKLSSKNTYNESPDYSIAFLLHYYMRSSKEYLLRLYRGDIADLYPDRKIEGGMFMRYNRVRRFNDLYGRMDQKIPEEERPVNDASKEILHELLELPGMKAAKEKMMSITSHRIETLLTYLRENIEELGEDWQLFLKNFEENCGSPQ